MTVRATIVCACSAFLLTAPSLLSAAATAAPKPSASAMGTHVLIGSQPEGFGGGPAEAPHDQMTDAQIESIRKDLAANIQRLRLEGRLARTTPLTPHPLFAWPLRKAAGIDGADYHGISNFVDLDRNWPNSLLDWNCGQRTYDTTAGYNHRGTDFFLWPWSWRKMDAGEIDIVAAAPGQILGRFDGNFDRSCGFNNNSWNAIYVQHSDGSFAYYGHMKTGSLTSKLVGDSVAVGEFLGKVGSSGNSTGPHLHFEVHDLASTLIEPWFGPCNSLNAESWWASQRPYYNSTLNQVTVGDAAAVFPSCSADETPNARTAFDVGPTVFFTAYYHDQLDTQSSTYTVYRPDGSIWQRWTHASNAPYYAASWWYWYWTISPFEMEGTWRFTVSYQSTITEKLFTIGSPGACGRVPETPAQGELLRLTKFGTSLELDWGASCSPQDSDFVVYEGTIGDFTTHVPVQCSTGGLQGLFFVPSSGSSYYLVGPRNSTSEGSLGTATGGVERPVSVSSCMTRLALPCP